MHICVLSKGFIIQQVTTKSNYNVTLLGFRVDHAPWSYLSPGVTGLGHLNSHLMLVEGCILDINSLALLPFQWQSRLCKKVPLCKEMLAVGSQVA